MDVKQLTTLWLLRTCICIESLSPFIFGGCFSWKKLTILRTSGKRSERTCTRRLGHSHSVVVAWLIKFLRSASLEPCFFNSLVTKMYPTRAVGCGGSCQNPHRCYPRNCSPTLRVFSSLLAFISHQNSITRWWSQRRYWPISPEYAVGQSTGLQIVVDTSIAFICFWLIFFLLHSVKVVI